MSKRRNPDQPDLFMPVPMIRGETTIGGRDVWYDRARMNWTTDPNELSMSDDALRAYREQQVRDFDAVMKAWGAVK